MSYVQSLLLLVCIALVIFSKSTQLDAPLIHSVRGRAGTTLRIFESPPSSPPQLKPTDSGDGTNENELDVNEGDMRIRGGARRSYGGIFSSFTRRRRARRGSIDSIDYRAGSPAFAMSPTSPTFPTQLPPREDITSPLSPRSPSPVTRSSPATPTGTRGREAAEAEEDGWRAFGPNMRVAELKAVHTGGSRQGWQKLRSLLGLSEDGDTQADKGGCNSGGVFSEIGEEGECSEVPAMSEYSYTRRQSEPAFKGEIRAGERVGGLSSPPISPPGSLRASPNPAGTDIPASLSAGAGAAAVGSKKGHSRNSSRKKRHKK